MDGIANEAPGAALFGWWSEADARAHRAFVAASLGWMLDSFDVMLYAMVLAELVRDPVIHLSFATAGLLLAEPLLWRIECPHTANCWRFRSSNYEYLWSR